jgi:Fe2+ transport system protein FeoA
MVRLADGERKRSLAEIQSNENVRIRSILFSMLRDLCRDLGIEEGDEVVCRKASSAVLILNARGRTVVLERDLARFIEVTGPAGKQTT